MNNYTKQHLREDIEFSYTEKGNIEILISPGYGAGWSSWNRENINLAVDKRIIDFYKTHNNEDLSRNEVLDFLVSIGYSKDTYVGGYYKLEIRKVPPNVKFRISEYDGSEDLIIYKNDELWEL